MQDKKQAIHIKMTYKMKTDGGSFVQSFAGLRSRRNLISSKSRVYSRFFPEIYRCPIKRANQ
jgi:hypothetical protein